MKYKLYDESINTSDVLEKVLYNRGIKDYRRYLNLNENENLTYDLLDNIDECVSVFMRHFNNKNKIEILVDSDPDGYCSAAMMYLYIKKMDDEYPVNYILHNSVKAHGLRGDYLISNDTKLLIIPDAGTNDVKECKELKENGIDIIILDHHESEKINPYAYIVNNQMSQNYYNKDLCGAGVVYKFLQALDAENWNEFADDYLDLCALANISDVMDMRSFETRYLTNTGLLNISNKCLLALIKAQDYSMQGKINVHNVQWYITPVLNACIRIGSFEEKELLFRAFIEQDEYFEYKKRATKDKPSEVIQESIYDRAARLCKNTKSRQDKLRDKGFNEIVSIVGNENVNENGDDKVVMVDVTNILNNGLTGVVAIKVAEKFNKPCILLRKHFDSDLNKEVYGGSARNINHSPIDSFKDIINNTNICFAQGHSNACGIVNLEIEKKDEALKAMNNILKDIVYDSTYLVDYIFDENDIDVSTIIEMSNFEDIICQGIEEPMIAVENISLTRDSFEIFGKNEDNVSFLMNGIKCIQFKCKAGNKLYDFLQNAWDDNDSVTFNIVGKPSINEYNGVKTPQIVISDVNVISIEKDTEDEW